MFGLTRDLSYDTNLSLKWWAIELWRWQKLFFNLLIYIQGVSITRTHCSSRLPMHFYWDNLYILHMHNTKHKSKHGTCDKKILTPTPVCSNFSFSAIFSVPKHLEIIILHHSSFILHHYSFILHHYSFILYSSFLHFMTFKLFSLFWRHY